MSLSATEVGELCRWLSEKLAGAALQKIRQPDHDTLALEFRVPGENLQLLLATGAGRARLHTIERAPRNPKQSHAFQGQLRKELRGSLEKLEHIASDRIVLLHLRPRQGERRTLVAELTDRHGNFFLLDDAGIILGSSRSPSSPTRPLLRGQRRCPPPQHQPGDRDRFSDLEAEDRDRAVREHFEASEARNLLETRRQRVLSLLNTNLRKLRRTAAKQVREADRAHHAQDLRRQAELLQSSFHALERGLEELLVDDYYLDPAQKVRIKLDPTLSPGEQIERRYQRAKRAERSGQQATKRLEQTRGEIALLEPLQEACKSAETIAGLGAIEEQLPPKLKARLARLREQTKGSTRSKGAPRTRLPFIRYRDSKGLEFRVGRGARENDELTFRHARGNDVWLHVRGRPGAHVVICRPGPSPSSEVLLIGAQLALAHSGLKEGAREEVSWTRVKEVHKSKGLPPGKVLLRSEKVLYVEARRADLSHLLRD